MKWRMKSKCASTITEPHFALTVNLFNIEGTSGWCIRALRKPLVQCIPKHWNLQQLRWSAIRKAVRKMGGPLHIFWTGRKNTVSQLVLDAVEEIPLMHELDDSPTRDELVNAIRILPQGKYPGKDWLIPAEVIKSGGNILSESLYKLLRQCWNEEAVPQEMRDSTIVTFFRNKSDRTESLTLFASIVISFAAPFLPWSAMRENACCAVRQHAEVRLLFYRFFFCFVCFISQSQLLYLYCFDCDKH